MIAVEWGRGMKRMVPVRAGAPPILLQSGLDMVAKWIGRHAEYRRDGTIPKTQKLDVKSFVRFLSWYVGEEVELKG